MTESPAGTRVGVEMLSARVLMVINSLGGGGAEHSLAELLPSFREAGIEPLVACLKRRKEGVEEEVHRAVVPVSYLPGNNLLTWAAQLRKLAVSKRATLIHTSIFEADIVGRLAAIGTEIPVLTSLVNTSYVDVRLSDPNVRRFGLWAVRMADGWTARHLTTHFHAISHTVKEASVEALGISPDRITVIERGRNTERLGRLSATRRNRARKQLGLSEDDEVVVSVGRQEFQKGQKFLLQAMAELVARRPRIRLLIAGRHGNASTELSAEHRRLGLGNKVRFLGYREDVPEILASADLFVFPSLYEGAGGALIEAMGLGLPVVASDIPSTREMTGDSACLVPAGSATALARGIGTLLDNPETARALGGRGLENFSSRFTLESSARRMIEMYRCLTTMRFKAHPN
jgi:glycosyltransferase involved in cell wall biosynthesis